MEQLLDRIRQVGRSRSGARSDKAMYEPEYWHQKLCRVPVSNTAGPSNWHSRNPNVIGNQKIQSGKHQNQMNLHNLEQNEGHEASSTSYKSKNALNRSQNKEMHRKMQRTFSKFLVFDSFESDNIGIESNPGIGYNQGNQSKNINFDGGNEVNGKIGTNPKNEFGQFSALVIFRLFLQLFTV